MEFSPDHTNYYERFFDRFFLSKILRWAICFFCHANAKLAPKQWTKIVIEDIANFRFRQFTVESCVCLLSQLVPVLNDTRGLAWIIHQLPHVSLCVYSRSLNVTIFLFCRWSHQTTKIKEFPVPNTVFTSVIANFTFTRWLKRHCWYNRTKQSSLFSDTQFCPI